MDQVERSQDHRARTFRLIGLGMGVSGVAILGVAAIFLAGILGSADNHMMLGTVLFLVGFSELGVAWFFFNKSQNL